MQKLSPRVSQRNASKALHTLAILSLLFATGCASISAPQQARTLSDFEQLSVQPDGSRAWRNVNTTAHNLVQIDPAAITFSPEVQIGDTQRDEIRATLLSALSERFASAGLQASKSANGRGTLNVRATVTAVELTSPALNVATTLILLAPVSRGGLTVEIEAVDALSGERVAALAFMGKAGLKNITSAYSSTGHAKLQANLAAEKFLALFASNSAAKATAP